MNNIIRLLRRHLEVFSGSKFIETRCALTRVSPQHISRWYKYEISQSIIKPAGQSEESYRNKIENTYIATRKIGFLLVNPKEVFSFWNVIGEPKEQSGFKRGAILINNKITYTEGGGLCQLSTAIYSAALHFGCRIIERYNHSSDIYGKDRYFTLGQDATVAYPAPDLVFKNHFDGPLVMDVRIKNKKIIVRLSSPKQYCNVEVTSKICKIIPQETRYVDMEYGTEEKGVDGKIVETCRTIHYRGNGVVTEKISRDIYKPIPSIVKRKNIANAK